MSVAHRHQRLLCYKLGSPWLCDSPPPECGPCNRPCSLESEPEHIRVSFTQLIPNMDSKTIAQPTWVKQFGLRLKKGAYIIICSDVFYPIVGKVHAIFKYYRFESITFFS